MRVIQRYFTSEITRSVFFALAAFLALFAFFEMMGQLEQVGRNGYKLQQAVFYVLMGLPGNVYELMPTAVLIGTIYTLSQLAARSEFTIMRVSSMSTGMAAKVLLRIGVGFAVLTIVFGELIAPKASEWAETTLDDIAQHQGESDHQNTARCVDAGPDRYEAGAARHADRADMAEHPVCGRDGKAEQQERDNALGPPLTITIHRMVRCCRERPDRPHRPKATCLLLADPLINAINARAGHYGKRVRLAPHRHAPHRHATAALPHKRRRRAAPPCRRAAGRSIAGPSVCRRH